MKKTNLISVVTACFLAINILTFLSSCEKNYQKEDLIISDPEPDNFVEECWGNGKLINYELVNSLTASQIKTIVGSSFAHLIMNGVNMYKVSYRTLYNGKAIIASGVIGMPDTTINDQTIVVMYNHGTRITEADLLPSGGYDLISVVSAANGKICFAADYIGFGDSEQVFHPYLIKSASIFPVCDMIIAGKEFLKKEYSLTQKPCLTMFGFSQGGHVTMAAQQVLENNPFYRNMVKLKGVALATGPYDLHDNSLLPIIGQETYPSPSFIIFAFISYNNYYKLRMNMDIIFKNSYAQKFLDLVAQNKTSAEIDAALPKQMTELFQDEFRTKFLAEVTIFNFLFKINATYKGWVPKSTTRIYSSPADEIVPYANAETAYNTFIAAGSQSVKLITLPPVSHVNSAFMAFADIISWIDAGCPANY